MLEDKNNPQAYTQTKVGIEPTFFGKVMTFFALAMLASTAAVFITQAYFIEIFFANPALIWVLFIVELGIIFTSRLWSQKHGLNYAMFALFAAITGVTIAPLLTIVAGLPNGTEMLTKALLATGLMFTATAVFGWTTKWDLSGLRGFLMMGLLGLIIIGVLNFFIPWSNTTEILFSGAGILIFSGFTMYDFQKLKRFPEDRYVEAALMLYLDIFNLFLYILRLIMALNRR